MCDFAKSVKLHTRKAIENRLLSRPDTVRKDKKNKQWATKHYTENK